MSHTLEDKDSLLKLAQLRSAIYRKLHVKFIEKILQMKGDINYKVPNSSESTDYTILHFAKQRDQTLEVIQLLMDYGADFTIKNNEEQTVLLQCLDQIALEYIEYSHAWGLTGKLSDKVVAAILSAHIEKSMLANPENKNGLTHCHMACMADHPPAVQMFMDSGVPPDLAVGKDSSVFPGCTALHIAIRSCALEVVKVLLECRADPCAKDRDGMTVMHWLIDNSIQILDSLIVEEVKVDRAIWISKLKTNQKIIYLLLKSNKVNSSVSMDEIGLSKFHIACSIGDAPVAEQFWSQGAPIDHRVNADSYLWPGYTALHFAAHFDVNTVHMLVKRGADIMAESTNGITPFDICLERYSIGDICLVMSSQPTWKNITLLGGKIKLLDLVSAMKDIGQFGSFLDNHTDNINASVDKNSPLWPGFTPLHMAVILSEQPKNASNYPTVRPFDTDLRLIEECLSRGADVTAEDAFGCTPLHLAFRHQRTRTIVKLLQFHHSTANPVDKYNVSHLHIACASGNKGVVKKLLQSGADPNLRVLAQFKFYRREARTHWLKVERIHAGSTPLHIAVAGKSSKVAQVLVDSGADVNATDENGATPIHCLLVQESQDTGDEMAEILLSANPTPVTVSGAGITHLHVASFFDQVDAVKRLLDLGADVDARLGCQSALNDFYERYDNGELGPNYSERFDNVTALHNAVWRTSTKTVKILISRGADLLTKSPCGESPLNSMISDENEGYCLTALAQILRENEALARRVREDYGLTFLHLASYKADADLVKTLIDDGANVNAQMTEEALDWAGYTPLHVIIEYSRSCIFYEENTLIADNYFSRNVLQTTRRLLDAGADVSLCDARGNTPLHLIANGMTFQAEFNGELLNMMLNSIKDFRVNPAGRIGMSHFHIACLQNNTLAIKKFLQHGVDVNAAIDFLDHQQAGCSALHLFARKALQNLDPLEAETIDALLAHGAEVDAQNADGETVLHVIARFARDRVDTFRRLFRAGADLTKMNILCQTQFATLLLSTEATPEVIELFIEHGCSVNEFNIADQQGFLAGPLRVSGSVLDDRTRIFETLFEDRNIAKSDATGRTAIHNIVSAAGFRISGGVSVEEYSRLIARLCNMGCDIDSQEQSGKTALHLAAQFKNNKAIAALLMNGADVNVVDTFDKTAFTYGAGICNCKSIERRHRHNDVIITFFNYLRKMNHFKLDINNVNRNVMSKVNAQPGFEADEMERFDEEVNQIRLFKFEENSVSFNLIDMLSETGLVAVYPRNASVRHLVDKFFQDSNVYLKGYTEVIGLLQFQIRKAVKRIELIDPVTESLNRAVAFSFPETCSRIVLRYLSNFDLGNLICAVNTSNTSCMLPIDKIRLHN